jgi:DNA topoisomerase VI subunit A
MSTAKINEDRGRSLAREDVHPGGNKPAMKFPLRALTNVRYQPKVGYLEMKGKTKERTLTVNTVKTFAQTLRMMALSKQLVDTDDIATKREAYYVSKNWDDARFDEQPESDTVMDDVEALFGLNREQLGFIPEEKGGEIAGKLVIVDKDAYREALASVYPVRAAPFPSGRALEFRPRRLHPGDQTAACSSAW